MNSTLNDDVEIDIFFEQDGFKTQEEKDKEKIRELEEERERLQETLNARNEKIRKLNEKCSLIKTKFKYANEENTKLKAKVEELKRKNCSEPEVIEEKEPEMAPEITLEVLIPKFNESEVCKKWILGGKKTEPNWTKGVNCPLGRNLKNPHKTTMKAARKIEGAVREKRNYPTTWSLINITVEDIEVCYNVSHGNSSLSTESSGRNCSTWLKHWYVFIKMNQLA